MGTVLAHLYILQKYLEFGILTHLQKNDNLSIGPTLLLSAKANKKFQLSNRLRSLA